MKKHSLLEHQEDVTTWWHDSREDLFPNDQTLFFIAYERWINDRELLTVEDEYEWKQPGDQVPRRGSIRYG